MKVLLAAALLATLVAERLPVMQDPQPRVLLQLEDDWAQALIHRDAAVFGDCWRMGSSTLRTTAR